MHDRRPRRWRRAGRRGVSEVVATILLLGMTITLFASIFVFTTRNPTAQPQALSQFTTSLSYGGAGGLQVLTVSITHLSGNVITGASTATAGIYISSQKHPTAIPSPFSLSAGLSGSTVWGFGQTWTLSISAYSIVSPDNLTVSVVSSDVLQVQGDDVRPGSDPFPILHPGPDHPGVRRTWRCVQPIDVRPVRLELRRHREGEPHGDGRLQPPRP